jgi:hypothetical protein
MIEPEILRNSIHPAVEPRAFLPLRHPRQGTRTSFLHEIIGLI